MTPLQQRSDPRRRQDGQALQVLLPGQYLLCTGQSGESRRATWYQLRLVKTLSTESREAEVRKLRGERN
jgi:hypothetical protein